MKPPNILFISASVGMGHVTRDLAIAAALRARWPGLRLVWLAADPATQALREAGEPLAPECEWFQGETPLAEGMAGEFSLHLTHPIALLRRPVRFWRSLAT
jgi:hypothetical protein